MRSGVRSHSRPAIVVGAFPLLRRHRGEHLGQRGAGVGGERERGQGGERDGDGGGLGRGDVERRQGARGVEHVAAARPGLRPDRDAGLQQRVDVALDGAGGHLEPLSRATPTSAPPAPRRAAPRRSRTAARSGSHGRECRRNGDSTVSPTTGQARRHDEINRDGHRRRVHDLTPDAPADAPVVLLCHAAPGSGAFDPDPAVTAARGVRLLSPRPAGLRRLGARRRRPRDGRRAPRTTRPRCSRRCCRPVRRPGSRAGRRAGGSRWRSPRGVRSWSAGSRSWARRRRTRRCRGTATTTGRWSTRCAAGRRPTPSRPLTAAFAGFPARTPDGAARPVRRGQGRRRRADPAPSASGCWRIARRRRRPRASPGWWPTSPATRSRDWGYTPSQVAADVLLAYGADDERVPPAHGEWYRGPAAVGGSWRSGRRSGTSSSCRRGAGCWTTADRENRRCGAELSEGGRRRVQRRCNCGVRSVRRHVHRDVEDQRWPSTRPPGRTAASSPSSPATTTSSAASTSPRPRGSTSRTRPRSPARRSPRSPAAPPRTSRRRSTPRTPPPPPGARRRPPSAPTS